MTCDDFRSFINRERFLRSTTAERTAWLRHYDSCPSCRAFEDSTPSLPISPEDDALIDAMLERDLADPEGLRDYRPPHPARSPR